MQTKTLKQFISILIGVWLLLNNSLLYGQISRKGTPPSIIYGIKASEKVRDFTPKLNINELKSEDSICQALGKPMRAGISIPINLDINNSGEWTQLPNGKMMWQLTLKADGAYAIGVVFNKFKLPKDAELYLYDSKKRMIIGAFGSYNNNNNNILSTRVLPGNEVIIEYVESPSQTSIAKKSKFIGTEAIPNIVDPSNYKSDALLSIGELVYTYINAFVFPSNDGSKPSTGSSASCMVNINCSPVGDIYQNQKRGVAHMFFPIGTDWYFCTGDLVNNTAQDGTPYFLTACHCGKGSSATDRSKWQFYFNYEYEGCENTGTPNTGDVLTGCTYCASGDLDGGSDFYLVELNETPPTEYNVYYNGWSREETGASWGAGIHHPAGDVKKISTFNTPLVSSQGTFTEAGTTAPNSDWKVVWSENENGFGITEGGSSGSPLFNESGLQVGTLTGGSVTCENPTDNEYYGRFDYHWDSNGTAKENQLAPWLDPKGTDQLILSGFDPKSVDEPPVANFSIPYSSITAGTEIPFNDESTNAPTRLSWTFDGGYPSTATSRKPKIIWITPGTYAVTLIATNNFGSDTITRNITVNASELPPTNPLIIGTESNESMFPFGVDGTISGNANKIRSASIYTAAELGGAGQISKLEWYVGKEQSDSRTISIYLKHTDISTFSSCTPDDIITDASLVYNGFFTPDKTGWTGFNLDNKFRYNGTQNLMVIVFINSKTTIEANSACFYSSCTGKHQQWKARNTDPNGNGTIDSLRPNIRISFEAFESPIAWFGIRDTMFTETFDEDSFPTNGWTTINADGSGEYWRKTTEYNHTSNGKSSAAHWYGSSSYNEKGWLISPQITLSENTGYQLNFYSFNHDPEYYSQGKNSVLISTTGTDSSDFNKVWTPTSVSDSWEQSTINLTEYAGKKIYIAFLYEGKSAHSWYLDDVTLYEIVNEPMSIYEGESISLYNASTNNSLVYQWKTPGATTTESYNKNVNLTYNEDGQYDISLIAGNAAGYSEKKATNYVTVIGRAPISKFKATGNLKTKTFQPFIPIGGTVKYTDASLQIPSSWNWTFEGGTPSSSTVQNPEVTYNTEGAYDLSYTTSNNHGSNTLDKTDYVKVGGSDFASNLQEDDELVVYNLSQGHLPGHGIYEASPSNYYFYQYAEYFQNSYPGQISSIKVGVHSNLGTGKYVKFVVWDGATGTPGTILASKSVEIASLQASSYNTIDLDAPVSISGDFFIGFEISYDTNHDFSTHCFSVYTALDRNAETSLWVKWGTSVSNSVWASLSQLFGIETSMAIHPYFTYTNGNTYALTLKADPTSGGNAIDNTNTSPYYEGVHISLSAVANDGYTFNCWKNGETVISTDQDFTYTMPAENTTLTAAFNLSNDVNKMETDNLNFEIYPNPCKGSFSTQLSISSDMRADISLMDITGRVIKQLYYGKLNKGVNNLDFTNFVLSNGIYIVKVSGYNSENSLIVSKTAKLIVIKK